MLAQGEVVVLGDSLLMESVENSLRYELGLNVTRVCALLDDVNELVDSIQPRLIVFEMDTPNPCSILSMFSEQSDALFLGVDINCSQVVVLNSQNCILQNLNELCGIISERL